MTKYLNKEGFSSPANNKNYRDNYDATFVKKCEMCGAPDINENFRLRTAISALEEYSNEKKAERDQAQAQVKALRDVLQTIADMVPSSPSVEFARDRARDALAATEPTP